MSQPLERVGDQITTDPEYFFLVKKVATKRKVKRVTNDPIEGLIVETADYAVNETNEIPLSELKQLLGIA